MKKTINARKIIIIALASILALSLFALASVFAFNYIRYQNGKTMLRNGDFLGAITVFKDYPQVDGADKLLEEACYGAAQKILAEGKHSEALSYFEAANGYSDAKDQIKYINDFIKANELIEKKEYSSALELLNALKKTEEVQLKTQEANYLLAKDYYSDGKYLKAIDHYTLADSYKDSRAEIEHCYYSLGVVCQSEGDLEKSIEYFKQAEGYSGTEKKLKQSYYELGLAQIENLEFDKAKESFAAADDYKDAKKQIIATDYHKGHQLFLEGKYEEADKYFAAVAELDIKDYPLHFKNMTVAESHIREAGDNLSDFIEFYIGKLPDGIDTQTEVMLLLYNYIPIRSVSVSYNSTTKLLSFYPAYYPGHRILYAHENNKLDMLSVAEKSAYNKAIELVEQAKNETQDEYALELWLHDWICNNTVYNNPDLSSSNVTDYRQLNCMGPLMDGAANCQGYADAFYLLASLAGFETRIVGSDDHAWNAIKLNDSWYAVDCTFNDLKSDISNAKYYIWFNSPFDSAEHTLYGGFETFPWICDENDYSLSYYTKYNLVEYDAFNAAKALVRQNVERGKAWTYVMVEGSEISITAMSGAIKQVLQRYTFSYKYWFEYHRVVDGNTYFTVYWYA